MSCVSGSRISCHNPPTKDLAEQRKKLKQGEELQVNLLHRAVPVVRTKEGLRAVSKGNPIAPEGVQRYLESKFGEAFPAARKAMAALARSLPPADLAATAYRFYEEFRPEIPAGKKGWGAAGVLEFSRIRSTAQYLS